MPAVAFISHEPDLIFVQDDCSVTLIARHTTSKPFVPIEASDLEQDPRLAASHFHPVAAMGKHFSTGEPDSMHVWKARGVVASDIVKRIQAARLKKGIPGPHRASVHRALSGTSFRRGRVESRGRKATLTTHNYVPWTRHGRSWSPRPTRSTTCIGVVSPAQPGRQRCTEPQRQGHCMSQSTTSNGVHLA